MKRLGKMRRRKKRNPEGKKSKSVGRSVEQKFMKLNTYFQFVIEVSCC